MKKEVLSDMSKNWSTKKQRVGHVLSVKLVRKERI